MMKGTQEVFAGASVAWSLGLSSGEAPVKIPYHSEQHFRQNIQNLKPGNKHPKWSSLARWSSPFYKAINASLYSLMLQD